MDSSAFIEKFESIFEAPGKSFEPSTRFKELKEWNSMHALYLVGMIDAEFGVEFTYTDLKSCTTVEDVYLIVKSRLA